ncbi:hypothetical protein NM208_g3322 [Fusarium decemcellulare]|uniref:Uncharacterized protein n=2 Tax=Fusarium decemcellulare TaxID=57161 RepID=A0ACC1SEQ8_9HYPO|nr:hypothetical protein NM208_g6076 [Fusarium decemcellulare]KAJ3543920.1 hypothetical protein NM208_g3322 [Fusarium decemcellulare]
MEQWCTLMDGIDGLKVQRAPMPTDLGHDEVLVRISRVSLNHRDMKIVCGDFRGRYDLPSEPMVVCSDASGIVVEVGGHAAASSWAKGDRVLTLVRPTHDHGPTRAEHHALGLGFPKPGVLCRYRIFKAAGLVRIPDSMSLDEACTLPTAGTTAWMALNWNYPIGRPRTGSDTTVLLQGTGGVSVITSSSEDKLQRARELGAQQTINYHTTPSWADEALRLTDGKGVDVIVETGGPATMQQSLKAVAEGGSISAVGVLTGLTEITGQTPIGLSLINRNATLRGINIGPKDRVEEMLEEYCMKRIHPVIDRQFGFDQVKEAFDYVRGGKHFGKVVINVDGT